MEPSYNSYLIRFNSMEIETCTLAAEDRQLIKYKLAIRCNNQFSVDIWTDFVLTNSNCKLHSCSVYNVANLPFNLEQHTSNEKVLDVLTHGLLASMERHREEMNRHCEGKKFNWVILSEKNVKKYKSQLRTLIVAANN